MTRLREKCTAVERSRMRTGRAEHSARVPYACRPRVARSSGAGCVQVERSTAHGTRTRAIRVPT